MKKEFLECGKIVGAHGVKGLMKVESWCDSPKILAAQKRVFLAEKDGSYKEVGVESASVLGPLVLMGLSGYTSREVVQGMKNTTLYLKREDIPLRRGAVLLADIIGLNAIDFNTGKLLGRVKDITDSPRNRLYVIETDSGKEVLIPDIKEFIKEINVEEGVYIAPIPGFFEEI
ncbi:MAG: 16S rRNA processing protein RimM [Clostridia bacterium]|nr:16S rRNA processing protein RimM [Clostridia bacterium]